MRRVVLIRHAHAEHGSADDRSRRLTVRGRAEAAALGAWLAGCALDRVLVSPARRAEETWRIAAEAGAAGEAVVCDDLYDVDRDAMLDLLEGCDDGVGCVGLVGHNPTLQEVAWALRRGGPDQDVLGDGFPPATALSLGFPHAARWADLGQRGGRIERLFTPPALRSAARG